MIVVNPASAIGSTQNQASFVTKNGIEAKELSSKAELAEEIIEALADLLKKRVIYPMKLQIKILDPKIRRKKCQLRFARLCRIRSSCRDG